MINHSLIHQICTKIAQKLTDPDYVVRISEDPLNTFLNHSLHPWKASCLDYGYPALIILFSELDRMQPSKIWKKARHDYISLLIREIQTHGFQDPSLFFGLTGICSSLWVASQSDPSYLKLHLNLHCVLLKRIEDYYLARLKQLELNNQTPFYQEYDLVSGISGVIAYLLHFHKNEECRVLIGELLRTVVRISYFSPGEQPPWYISPDSILQYSKESNLLELYPNGFFDTGLSHGISGCLAIMAKATIAGFHLEHQQDAMKCVIQWLQMSRQNIGSIPNVWPKRFGYSSQSADDLEIGSDFYFDGWSYGAPGILNAMLLAAQSLNDQNLFNYAVQHWIASVPRLQTFNTLSGLSFCYGYSGILAIARHFARQTRYCQLDEMIDVLMSNILSRYDERLSFGFQCSSPSNSLQDMHLIDNVGLITGSIGVILTLLSCTVEEPPLWTPLFIID